MKSFLKTSISFLLAITFIFSSMYVGLSEVDFGGLFAVKAEAVSVEDLTFTLNYDGVSYSVTDCNESATGELIIPDTYNSKPVTSIDEKAFYNCAGITSIVIPDSVTSIGNYAFYYCTSLTSITIPNSVTDIGNSAFYYCTSLTSITIPNSVTDIGNSAFSRCTSLSSITIPDSVTSIGVETFINCSSLTSITIPNSVTSIGRGAFWGCIALNYVKIGNGITDLSDSVFRACYSLTSLAIPNTVKSIGDYAFWDCSGLESITIPNSVTNIGSFVFRNCESLSSINVDPLNTNYSSVDGVLLNKDKTVLVYYPEGKKQSSYYVPNGVTSIGDEAFYDCKNLVSVVLPDSVTSIGDNAFGWCENLASVTIGNNITVIGDYAFSTCSKLASVTIPDSVMSIGEHAFDGCLTLASVDFGNGVKTIGFASFQGCYNLVTVKIGIGVTNISSYAFNQCKALKKVYYSGSKSDWDKINIGTNNTPLVNATFYYNSSNILTPKAVTENVIGGVLVKWNAVSGAVKYNVYRRQGGTSAWVYAGTTTGTSLTDTKVSSGIYYVYSVRAYNNAGQYSDFVSANTQTRKYMAVPKLKSISNATNGLYITWNAVGGVTNGYRVYRRGAGSTYWTYLGTTKNTYFTDTAVKNKNGEYFRYTVIADGGYHSKFDTTGLYLRRITNPVLKSATSAKAGITVKWGAVSGSTGYYVYRKTANSGWQQIGVVKGANNVTFLDKTAKKGVTYTYTVRAACGTNKSYFNSGISCKDKY